LNSAKEAKRSNRPYVHVHVNSLRPGKIQKTGYLGKNPRPYNYNNTNNNNNNNSSYRHNIDFIEPYPDEGYVLNFIDTFTRWVELYPVPEATAEYAAKFLLQHFGRYGSPIYIRSDKGSHFANSVIDKFLTTTSALHNLTLQYSSQENSIVERNNKEINRHLRALTFDKNTVDDYLVSLPFVQRILNSSYNSRRKISPADLLFGNAIDLSGGSFNSIKQQETNILTYNLLARCLTYKTI
jgi:hypothetical protein